MRIVFGCDPNAAELKKNLMKMCITSITESPVQYKTELGF